MISDSELDLSYVISAIFFSKFELAKLLCEIIPINIKDEEEFAFLYGLVNVALKNNLLSRNIVSSVAFIERFQKSRASDGTTMAHHSDSLNNTIQSELKCKSSQLCIYLKSELKVLKSMDEISLLISEFEKTIANLDSLSTNELLNQSLISKFSGSPALDLYIGRLLLKRTEYLKSKIVFERAFSSNPFNPKGFDQYSTVLWHLNDKDALFSLVLHMKRLFNTSAEYFITKGNYHSFMGANEKAIFSFRKALEVDPDATYALFLEGHDWLSLNNLDEAEVVFDKLSRLDSDSFMSYFGLGIVNYKRKKYERALSFFNLAHSLNPFNFNIICYKSIVLESLGKHDSALDVLQLHDIEMTPILYFRKAKLYASLSSFKEAESVLLEAVQKFPNDPALYFCLAEIFQSRGKMSDSVKFLQKANELDLNNATAKELINFVKF